jgi:hypothetical protein
MPGDTLSKIAFVRFIRGAGIDRVLGDAAADLKSAGILVGGAVQDEERQADGCCGPMMLGDLQGGAARLISQSLGLGAKGCRLDTQALAAAAAHLLAVVDAGVDVLVINRFGKSEADGGGLRAVIERAVERDIPVVLAVREDFLPAWSAFHGGMAVELSANAGAVATWARSVCRTPTIA